MRKILLTTASALSLILATAAWAQTRDEGGMGGARDQGPGQGQDQMAPGGGGAPSMHGGASGGAQPGKGETMRGEQGGQTMHQGADENMGGEKSKGAENGQSPENGKQEKMQRQGFENGKGAGEKMQGETSKGAGREHGESGKAASLSSEQKTRVRSSFHGASIREAQDIKVTHVSIGARIPRTVVNYWEPVPAAILEVVPAWRDYKVVRIRGNIVVINPDTYEIVYVM